MIGVTRRHEIASSASRVYPPLVDPAHLTRWFCDEADVAPREGGRYAFGGPRAWRNEDGTHGSVTWILAPDPAGTRLTLAHEALPKKPGVLGDCHTGWWEFLTGLKFLAEAPS